MSTVHTPIAVDFDLARPSSASFIAPAAASEAGVPVNPHGASPALDLQRRLEAAVMQSFYAKAEPKRWSGFNPLYIVIGCALTCWAAVFGAEYVIFR